MYDAIIIGSGPGGYVCAIKIAQLGGKALVVEKGEIGGTCTNWGCIPTKALHYSASLVSQLKKAKRVGVRGDFSLDFNAVMQRKDRIVNVSKLGIKQLLDSYGVKIVNGYGKIVGKNKVDVDGKMFEAKNIVIATGSEPIMFPGLEISNRIITVKELLNINELPKELAVVGGGIIGCEIASIFNAFGVKISVYEMLPRLLATEDEEISKKIEQIFKRNGINVVVNKKVDVAKLKQEKVLIAVGLKPVFDKQELDKIGVKYDKYIEVDEYLKTSVKNIYAIGDVTGKMLLAHLAYAQAEIAAMNIMGKKAKIDYNAIPSCIFTLPDIASVGSRKGKTAVFPYAANGKARTMEEIEGFVKVYSDGKVLTGCSIVGAHADDIIHLAAIAVKNKIKLKDLKETVFAHPTLSEAFIEAVRALDNEAVHLPKK